MKRAYLELATGDVGREMWNQCIVKTGVYYAWWLSIEIILLPNQIALWLFKCSDVTISFV